MKKGERKIVNENSKPEKDLLKEIEELKRENQRLKDRLLSKSGGTDNPGRYSQFVNTEYHDAFFNQVPFLMWAKNLKGEYLSVNSTFSKKFNPGSTDVIGKTDFDLFPEKYARQYSAIDEIVFNSGQQYSYESQVPIESGLRWYEIIKVPLHDKKKKVSGLAGFARDIGDRKQYEVALKESEEKFRELAESVSDSFILNSGESLIYVNPAFEIISGYSREELYKDPDLHIKIIHPEDAPRIIRKLNSDEYRKSHVLDEQYRIIKKNGEISWIWSRSFPVEHEGLDESDRIVTVASNITEIKKLEEDLLKYRFEQQAILDNIPHLAWLKDEELRYISVNQSFAKFHKLKPKDIIGKTDFELVSREFALDYSKKDKEILKNKKSNFFFEVEEGKFGRRYSETYKTPVIDEDGSVIGIAGISRDITDQKIAEEALIKSEEKFKDLVTLLPEVIFETDDSGRISFVNLKGYELTGYTLGDMMKGMDLISFISPDDRERARDLFREIKKGKELRGMDFMLLTKTGNEIPVAVYTNNMYQDGKWIGIRGVLVDNSNRRKVEEAEKMYQSKLVYLSDTALDFLSMTQEDSLFDFIGVRLKELLHDTEIIINNYDEESRKAKMVYNSFNLSEIEKMQSLIKIPPEDFEWDLTPEEEEKWRKSGDHLIEFPGGFYESTMGKVSQEASESLSGLLGIQKYYGIAMVRSGVIFGSILLLTRRDKLPEKHFIEAFIYQASIALSKRKIERELIEAKTIAEESDRLKTAFLANMSHEIRTPMNGILGLTQLMSSHPVTIEQRQEYLAMINANGKMLLELVNDIIDISKIESRQVDLFESEFSLNQMMDDLYCFISAEKMVKNMDDVELIYKPYFEDDNSVIFSDQAKIRQVLTNLIGNAVKFTKKGAIEFGYRTEGNKSLLFYVKDSGIGIKKDKINVIFDRFTQADQSLTRPYGGSGLGLAISKGFVNRMGGEIWAESEEGNGSSFYFTIPYKSVAKTSEKQLTSPVSMDFDWSNLTILVVEDNLISYKLLEISLLKTGSKVLHAENGQEAVDMVKENPGIDLVLMDIQLPVKNGYVATMEIKQINPDLPVIAQTANAMDDDKQKCIEAGCSDYITKPIVIEKLLPVIEEYLK